MTFTLDFTTMRPDEMESAFGTETEPLPVKVIVAKVQMRFSSCGSITLRKYATAVQISENR